VPPPPASLGLGGGLSKCAPWTPYGECHQPATSRTAPAVPSGTVGRGSDSGVTSAMQILSEPPRTLVAAVCDTRFSALAVYSMRARQPLESLIGLFHSHCGTAPSLGRYGFRRSSCARPACEQTPSGGCCEIIGHLRPGIRRTLLNVGKLAPLRHSRRPAGIRLGLGMASYMFKPVLQIRSKLSAIAALFFAMRGNACTSWIQLASQ
jgi:hypothetical protein